MQPKKLHPVSAENAVDVHLKINGKDYALTLDPRTTLLDCVREHLHLTGTKKGCDHGQCGACTVHVNGRRRFVPLPLPPPMRATRSRPLKGSASRRAPPDAGGIRRACEAYQCGYCTSGQIMSAVALLNEPYGPDDAEVKEP